MNRFNRNDLARMSDSYKQAQRFVAREKSRSDRPENKTFEHVALGWMISLFTTVGNFFKRFLRPRGYVSKASRRHVKVVVPGGMFGKAVRLARSEAFKAASSRNLWQDGEKQVFKGIRGLYRRLFHKRLWMDRIGSWYKTNLKHFSKEAANYFSSGKAERDYLERRRFAHVQRKAARKRQHEAMQRIVGNLREKEPTP